MSDNDGQPYIIVEKSGSGVVAFFWGALVGAAAALLFAPKSGEETQRELREGARRLRRRGEEKFGELRSSVEEGYERARDDLGERVEVARDGVKDRKRKAQEALKAGKEAAKEARVDLEKRVADTKAAYKAAITEAEDGSEPS